MRIRDKYQVKEVLVSEIKPTTNSPSKELKQSLFSVNGDEEVKELELIEEPRIQEISHPEYKYEKLTGGRRIESYRQAGIEKIRVIVVEADPDEVHWIGLISNAGTPNYAEEAEHMTYLHYEEGKTQTEIARRTGYSIATVSGRLRLKERLISEIFELLRKGEITSDTAYTCTKLTKQEQEQLLQSLKISGKSLSGREAREAFRQKQSNYFVEETEEELELEGCRGLFIEPEQLTRLEQGEEVEFNFDDKVLVLRKA